MSIVKEIQGVLNKNVIKTDDVSNVKKYLEASKFYESLIQSGITQKRGNNLLPKDRMLSSTIKFNVS